MTMKTVLMVSIVLYCGVVVLGLKGNACTSGVKAPLSIVQASPKHTFNSADWTSLRHHVVNCSQGEMGNYFLHKFSLQTQWKKPEESFLEVLCWKTYYCNKNFRTLRTKWTPYYNVSNVLGLADHNIDCGPNGLIRQARLVVDDKEKRWAFEYQCAVFEQPFRCSNDIAPGGVNEDGLASYHLVCSNVNPFVQQYQLVKMSRNQIWPYHDGRPPYFGLKFRCCDFEWNASKQATSK